MKWNMRVGPDETGFFNGAPVTEWKGPGEKIGIISTNTDASFSDIVAQSCRAFLLVDIVMDERSHEYLHNRLTAGQSRGCRF